MGAEAPKRGELFAIGNIGDSKVGPATLRDADHLIPLIENPVVAADATRPRKLLRDKDIDHASVDVDRTGGFALVVALAANGCVANSVASPRASRPTRWIGARARIGSWVIQNVVGLC